ncbi:MAG: hypothetical protein WA652_00050 [Xanthobacteraceae bacterium]
MARAIYGGERGETFGGFSEFEGNIEENDVGRSLPGRGGDRRA